MATQQELEDDERELGRLEKLWDEAKYAEMAKGYCHEGLRDVAVFNDTLEIGVCSFMLRVPNTSQGRETALRWIAEELISRARRYELGC